MELPWAALNSMFDDVRRAWESVGDVQQRSMAVTGTATSDDGLITAVVGPRGHLVGLTIDPGALRDVDADSLAARILATARRAVADVSGQRRAIVDAALPSDLSLDRLGGPSLQALLGGHDADVPRTEGRRR
jgi:DNA-binding protein YbaB